MTHRGVVAVCGVLVLVLGCGAAGAGGGGGGGDTTCTAAQLSALEAQMGAGLDAAAADPAITSDPDFTVLLEAGDGRRFTHAHGAATATTRYESASTSKLVTAVVILDLVDRGYLSLDTRAHDLLPFWAETSVTLRQLLAFTSGFQDEPLCLDAPGADFAACVEAIYTRNAGNGIAPGTQFYYASTHLQVAGLMAVRARGASSWGEVWDEFKARTGLFATSAYDLPSASNPRLAGGMHWTGEEYLAFLRALATGALLSDAARAQLFASQRGDAAVAYSPALEAAASGQGLGEDWAYGLGNWLECPTAHTAGTFDCGAGHRNSSPGSYGAYPFLDFDHGYVGLLARQGALGTYPEGVRTFRAVEDLAGRWAARSCAP